MSADSDKPRTASLSLHVHEEPRDVVWHGWELGFGFTFGVCAAVTLIAFASKLVAFLWSFL